MPGLASYMERYDHEHTSAWNKLGFWWPYMFFPLWFGFILVLDGLNVTRSGTSPLR